MLECTFLKHGFYTERRSVLKTSSAKAKGRSLQQWTRDKIIKEFSLEPDDVRSVSMGVSGEDLLFSPSAGRLLGISVECKSRDKVAIYGWYDQAIENTPQDREPVVVLKANRRSPLVAVDAEFFFSILRQARGWNGKS